MEHRKQEAGWVPEQAGQRKVLRSAQEPQGTVEYEWEYSVPFIVLKLHRGITILAISHSTHAFLSGLASLGVRTILLETCRSGCPPLK